MISLYIHIPFCEHKCFYCSFVVSVGQEHRIDAYLDALGKEAQSYRGTKIGSIYLGGGTPSFLNTDQFKRLSDLVHHDFSFSGNIEWTLEANPESVDENKAAIWKQRGVNRVSLGVQSLNNQFLRYLGRNHDRLGAGRAYHVLRDNGFDNINMDLMYSFPQQTKEALTQDVLDIAQFGSDHLSLYSLTIEENSRFYTKKVQLSDGDRQGEDYALVMDLLNDAGFRQYEVSNFAKPGRASIHNLNYWRGGDYIGLGVGAHSHLNGRRYWNVSKFSDYLSQTSQGQSPVEGEEFLDPQKRFMETLLFGLRTNEGVDVLNLEKRFHVRLNKEREIMLEEFIEHGLCERDTAHIRVTHKGRLILD